MTTPTPVQPATQTPAPGTPIARPSETGGRVFSSDSRRPRGDDARPPLGPLALIAVGVLALVLLIAYRLGGLVWMFVTLAALVVLAGAGLGIWILVQRGRKSRAVRRGAGGIRPGATGARRPGAGAGAHRPPARPGSRSAGSHVAGNRPAGGRLARLMPTANGRAARAAHRASGPGTAGPGARKGRAFLPTSLSPRGDTSARGQGRPAGGSRLGRLGRLFGPKTSGVNLRKATPPAQASPGRGRSGLLSKLPGRRPSGSPGLSSAAAARDRNGGRRWKGLSLPKLPMRSGSTQPGGRGQSSRPVSLTKRPPAGGTSSRPAGTPARSPLRLATPKPGPVSLTKPSTRKAAPPAAPTRRPRWGGWHLPGAPKWPASTSTRRTNPTSTKSPLKPPAPPRSPIPAPRPPSPGSAAPARPAPKPAPAPTAGPHPGNWPARGPRPAPASLIPKWMQDGERKPQPSKPKPNPSRGPDMGNDNTGGGSNFAKQAEDKSLYGLGKMLGQVAPPIAEQANDIRRLAETVEGEQGAMSPVIASQIREAAKLIQSGADLLGELPATFARQHRTDIERTENGRGGRAAEKRADVSWSERDGF